MGEEVAIPKLKMLGLLMRAYKLRKKLKSLEEPTIIIEPQRKQRMPRRSSIR